MRRRRLWSAWPLGTCLGLPLRAVPETDGKLLGVTSSADADLNFVAQIYIGLETDLRQSQRGFCKECGSALFWKGDGRDTTSIRAGSLDGATGLKLEGHIYCDNAGDYYEIVGGGYKISPSGS